MLCGNVQVLWDAVWVLCNAVQVSCDAVQAIACYSNAVCSLIAPRVLRDSLPVHCGDF
jgi:hypothetical protein